MRVVRSAGQNVSPSDDGRLFAQIFSDGLFTDTTFTNLGGNNIQIGAMYGDLCGRDFTVEQMTLSVALPDSDTEVTGYIYVEIDTSSDDVITVNSALAPFTPTYEDINTNGAVAQMILAEYTASAVAVTSVTAKYEKAGASSVKAGSVATVETAQATESHAVGDYILLGGQLYVVTDAVSTGETFVEGTNIESTSVGDELTALNNGLTTTIGNDTTLIRKGNLVTIFFSSNDDISTLLDATIPAEFRSHHVIRCVGQIVRKSDYHVFMGRVYIGTDGKMRFFYPQSYNGTDTEFTVGSGFYFMQTCTYVI